MNGRAVGWMAGPVWVGALGISSNKGQTGSVVDAYTLAANNWPSRPGGINIHFDEMRAPDDVL